MSTQQSKKRPQRSSVKRGTPPLQTILKCIKCKKVAIYPVHSCPAGHIVCGVCFEVVEKCKCGEPLSPRAMLRCRNVLAGCNVKVQASDLRKHLKACEYRCRETKPTDCGGQIFSLDKFLSHLKKYHKSGLLKSTKRRDGIIAFYLHIKHEELELHGEFGDGLVERGETDYFLYDKKTFLNHMVFKDDMLFWWITLIGSEQEALKYRYVLKFKGKDNPSAPKVEWELPVYSVRYCDFEKVKETGALASYPIKLIKSYYAPNKGFWVGEEDDYIWTVEIEMKKVND